MQRPETHFHSGRDAASDEFPVLVDIIIRDRRAQSYDQVVLVREKRDGCYDQRETESAPMVSGFPTAVVVTGSFER